MTDVFLRLAPKSPLRLHLAAAVYARWLEELTISFHPIWMEGTFQAFDEAVSDVPTFCEVELPEENFQWTSRRYAEEHAESDPYIFCDDDHLVLGKDFAPRLLEEWVKHPGYVLLTASSAVRGETPYPGTLWQEGVYEQVACVGATMVHKKGVIPYHQFSGKASMQDSVVCDWLAAHGHKFALSKAVHYLHLGFGLSQVEPLLWGRY